MRVAINGIGVAGPTLAYWLRESGHEPVLFEKALALRAGGYLIDFWGLGYEIAERMGILPALRERCYVMKRLSMVDSEGREEASMDVTPMREALGGRFISLSRSDCDGIPAHFGVSINGIETDDRHQL
jgi:2-polyprenyl-6-methoxyphenol hydroxylase-like FAD-dependent oxidoreductase